MSELFEALRGWLNLWNSSAIILGFSFLVVGLDEWVAKPMRSRRLEMRAAAGDKEAQELLRIARSAHVNED